MSVLTGFMDIGVMGFKIKQLETKIDKLSREITEAESQNRVLNDELKDATTQIAQLEKTNAFNKEQIKSFKRKFITMSNRHSNIIAEHEINDTWQKAQLQMKDNALKDAADKDITIQKLVDQINKLNKNNKKLVKQQVYFTNPFPSFSDTPSFPPTDGLAVPHLVGPRIILRSVRRRRRIRSSQPAEEQPADNESSQSTTTSETPVSNST